ncbi:hypothetical protein OG948_36630 (plasmid) [Embleya sp. NBC_00888]|uniref:hypothetical protein n=1 Tax=Embleya sp. NBC_00888 TaxID=2975960 RepID=UPI002F9154BC|nr:hypothetical protein OG948_36630 [Embleya sp. NBC_00888]
MSATRPPADRDLPNAPARRNELVALLEAAEARDAAPRRPWDRLPPRGTMPPRRVLIPIAAAVAVGALVTGVVTTLHAQDGTTGPAAVGTAPATTGPPPPAGGPTPPAGQVPVPADRAVPPADAARLVRDCVASSGHNAPDLAARYRPYFAVRAPEPQEPERLFVLAVDDADHAVGCTGGGRSTASPDGITFDLALLTGVVDIDDEGTTKSGTRYLNHLRGRYAGPVVRVTVDHGEGERPALLAGGIWYAEAPTARMPDPLATAHVRGYDAGGTIVWDSTRDAPTPNGPCVRTPDNRLLGYQGRPEQSPAPDTCRPAIPWTAGK